MMKPMNFDIVLIRHAESLFNQATWNTAAKLSLQNLSWDELIQNPDFNNLVTYNRAYMDPPLSEKGRNQCLKYRQQCAHIKPDLILVSPYRRALQTCNLLFGKQKHNVIVQPILSQVFRFSCDVPDKWQIYKKMFPLFNFDKVEKHGNQWYLQNLQPQVKLKIRKKLGNDEIDLQNQKRQMILQMMENKQIHQNPRMLRSRASKIKKLLQQYKTKHKKIVVVAHYYIIQYLKSKGFNQHGDLLQYHGIPNCYPFYENSSDLLNIY